MLGSCEAVAAKSAGFSVEKVPEEPIFAENVRRRQFQTRQNDSRDLRPL
jgi:hypothetical protein